ncbi:MAG: methylated-DNA--[protein]-cysteine S-methyltransferase [Solirubrobacteraceae bacterium]
MNEIEETLRSSAMRLPADVPAALQESLAERAASEGLLDVAYAELDSPIGPLAVASTDRGLVRLAYMPAEAMAEELAVKLSPRVIRSPQKLDEVRRELHEYFEGRRTDFDVPVDWSLSRGFSRRVLERTAQIPYGQVGTYAKVAKEAGSPRAVRAAGNALGANPVAIVVPCHRILRTGGTLGGYGGGPERKEFLLRLEGVLAV